ncbi:hypothetical protein BDF21DRAFT_424266 [Thamnidium elegans]|nr:hypothetical protein BDF21DRAFT_424266 [Thamnidium elegans]
MSAYNNNTTFNTNPNTTSTGLHNQQPGQLNENHGITATGLNNQHGFNSSGPQHQSGLSGAAQDIKNVGTNGITNNTLDHGHGTNGITNNPLYQDHHKTGVPVTSHGVNANHHLNNNTHNTGTAFAGTNATLGAVGQPDTQSRTANHLGHTGQPKTHNEIDDLASSRPRDHSRSPGAAGVMGADEITKHTINKNHGGAGSHSITGQNSVASDARRSNDPYTTSTGSDLTGASALQSNTPGSHGHSNHHGVGAAAAGAGATALGAREHNKHNNHHTTGTGVPGSGYTGNTTGLGTQDNKHGPTSTAGTSGLDPRDNKHDITSNDHHRTGTGISGTTAHGAHGAHEHSKINKPGLPSDVNHSTTGTGVHDHETNNVKHVGGGISAVKGDHGASNHIKHDPNVNNNLNTKRNSIKDDLKLGGEEPGVHDSRGVRHAGVPLHEGLAPVHDYDREHLNDTNKANDIKDTTDIKPSAGDKIKGNLEKIAGKITGNEEKIIKGENIAHGRAV